jgi:hypothetical protein
MLGTSAYLTKSTLPGVVVHAIGLLTFFSLVWPEDPWASWLLCTSPDCWA